MTEKIRRIGLLYNPRVAAAQQLAEEIAELLRSEYNLWLESAWAQDEIYERADECDLLLTFGGDGTILRVTRSTLGSPDSNGRSTTPPMLAIDFGTLGFLAEMRPEAAAAGLRQVLAGEFWLEERWLLHAALVRDGQTVREQVALNDVVLARGDGPHAIHLTVSIDDAETASYTADAMIVASPTGSTAYALAAGGPIMGPALSAMLTIPVAPHLAVSRGFVVPDSSRITLQASAHKATVVTLDGQITIPYLAGDLLHVTRSDAVARFVRTGPRNYFYTTLNQKLRR